MAIIRIMVLILVPIVLTIGIIALINMATPQEFQYKDHDYIYFPSKGIAHSPECHKCAITFERI